MRIKKPWGKVQEYVQNQTATVRLIYMEPHQETSLHRHHLRDDMWVILDDGLSIQIGNETKNPAAGEEFVIPSESLHRIISKDTPGRVLEINFGYSNEEDVERIKDEYGRMIQD